MRASRFPNSSCESSLTTDNNFKSRRLKITGSQVLLFNLRDVATVSTVAGALKRAKTCCCNPSSRGSPVLSLSVSCSLERLADSFGSYKTRSIMKAQFSQCCFVIEQRRTFKYQGLQPSHDGLARCFPTVLKLESAVRPRKYVEERLVANQFGIIEDGVAGMCVEPAHRARNRFPRLFRRAVCSVSLPFRT